MATVGVNFTKTTVSVVSTYRIEEERPDRLVLRAKKTGYYLGGGVLGLIGAALLGVSIPAFRSGLGLGAFALALGLLLGWAAVALVRKGARNNDRIVFDAGGVRFEMTDAAARREYPREGIERLEIQRDDQSRGSETRIVHRLSIVTKDGSRVSVDEASREKAMRSLAEKAAAACGVSLARIG
jgi:hypothetical protein